MSWKMISRENNTAVFTDGKFRLRCRLMPCIYSEMAAVHFECSTMMRIPAFDFRRDAEARNIGDQFMFGRALMVCPVLRAEKKMAEAAGGYICPGAAAGMISIRKKRRYEYEKPVSDAALSSVFEAGQRDVYFVDTEGKNCRQGGIRT